MQKRLTLIIGIILMVSALSFGQGFRYGVHAGGTISTILEKSDLESAVSKSHTMGFNAGVTLEFEILSFLSVGTQISFFQKGDKIKDNYVKSGARLDYLDIPIQVSYKIPLGNFKLAVGVGPYTSVAVGGRRKWEPIAENVPDFEWNFQDHGHEAYINNSTQMFGESWNSFRRFDTGMMFGLKLDYRKFQLNSSYSIGFIDIRPDETIKAQNSSFQISLVYFING